MLYILAKPFTGKPFSWCDPKIATVKGFRTPGFLNKFSADFEILLKSLSGLVFNSSLGFENLTKNFLLQSKSVYICCR